MGAWPFAQPPHSADHPPVSASAEVLRCGTPTAIRFVVAGLGLNIPVLAMSAFLRSPGAVASAAGGWMAAVPLYTYVVLG